MSFESEREMQVIDKMIKEASAAGVLSEVIWSFSKNIEEGESVSSAAKEALESWNLGDY